MITIPPSIKVETEAKLTAGRRLSISYRALNTSGRDVYAFNRLFATDRTGHRTVDSNKVYCEVIDTVLHISKRLVEVPRLVLVESPEVPYLTYLAPKAEVKEDLYLELPVRESYPYAHPEAEKSGHMEVCQLLVFTLGYFVPRSPGWIKQIIKGEETLLATDYGFAIQANQAVSSQPIPLRLECIVLDDPRRRR